MISWKVTFLKRPAMSRMIGYIILDLEVSNVTFSFQIRARADYFYLQRFVVKIIYTWRQSGVRNLRKFSQTLYAENQTKSI